MCPRPARLLATAMTCMTCMAAVSTIATAQGRGGAAAAAPPARPTPAVAPATPFPSDPVALTGVRWREIGPFRGGRSVAVSGNYQRPAEFWMGTVGGGVFKSVDAGQSWAPVTDRYFGGTIGAIAVSRSSPDVVYVGGGEYAIRGNVSHGDGVWKTTDGGRTWTSLGLRDTKYIADIVVHPSNPDLVYVGALGPVFGPSPARGVFRSRDGGKNWEKILFRNDSTGIIDLVMDPTNPSVLYAAFWEAHRKPWMLSSGGPGSGLLKSTDGGTTWTELTRNPGLPQGLWGNVGVAVSGANPNRIWAIIEADSGGVHRSDDGGRTWQRLNTDRALRQRAWYYTRIHADPRDTSVVYVNNVQLHKSTDGGRTFRPVANTGHADSHDLWIDPANPMRMVEANDGGANVTTDGGRTWSDLDFATAQFYRVITTNHFPYQVCGAQQDNSTLCGPSRGDLSISAWKNAGGGESGWIASRHDDPDIIYAGSYGGLLTRRDMRTGLQTNITVWPDNPMGHPAASLKYRFQWTFPIIVSRHNPNIVYVGSQHVHRSSNGGRSWTVISPDLSYNDPATMGNSGGPITRDQTSVEYYGTVFMLEESPVRTGFLWAGTDDGRVHLTRNGGTTWTDVTPKDMQKFTRVSSIDASRFGECIAFVAGNRFQLDDDRPYLWRTSDCGQSWTRIDTGIPDTEFTRVVRENPARRGFLVAGTERGVWFSANDGRNWQSLQLNLPPVPIHDLQFKDGDIVLGTHGRSFWIMDNISTLEQMTERAITAPAHLFRPADQYRAATGGRGGGSGAGGAGAGMQGITPETAPAQPVGDNPPGGIQIQYMLRTPAQQLQLDLLDNAGRLIRSYDASALSNRAGINTFSWNMRYPDATGFPGMILWSASTAGPTATPGTYRARLLVNGDTVATQPFRILADPRIAGVTAADWNELMRFQLQVRDRFTEANQAVQSIRHIRAELADRRGRLPAAQQGQFAALAESYAAVLGTVEDSLYQTQNRSGQDPLNYPIRLNNRIGALMGTIASSEGRPTAQAYEVFTVLSRLLDVQLSQLRRAHDASLPRLNAMLRTAGLPVIEPRPAD
jgi:photosystem II stability/assembly factor-like uncharacterized protein